jgi:hypothetical protein
MSGTIFCISFLIGAALCLRTNVLILYDAIVALTVGLWASNLAHHNSFGETLLINLSLAIALQLGYLFSIVLQAIDGDGIKRLCTPEAERRVRFPELKVDSLVRDGHLRADEYRCVERRMTPRHQAPKAGVILLERQSPVGCVVQDFSPTGVGLLLPSAGILPAEFDLTFDHGARRCITVWRQLDRVGLKFKST